MEIPPRAEEIPREDQCCAGVQYRRTLQAYWMVRKVLEHYEKIKESAKPKSWVGFFNHICCTNPKVEWGPNSEEYRFRTFYDLATGKSKEVLNRRAFAFKRAFLEDVQHWATTDPSLPARFPVFEIDKSQEPAVINQPMRQPAAAAAAVRVAPILQQRYVRAPNTDAERVKHPRAIRPPDRGENLIPPKRRRAEPAIATEPAASRGDSTHRAQEPPPAQLPPVSVVLPSKEETAVDKLVRLNKRFEDSRDAKKAAERELREAQRKAGAIQALMAGSEAVIQTNRDERERSRLLEAQRARRAELGSLEELMGNLEAAIERHEEAMEHCRQEREHADPELVAAMGKSYEFCARISQ